MRKQLALHILSFASIVLFSITSSASFGLLETAEILPAGRYRIGFAPQLYLGNGGGVDGSTYLDINLTPDINSRFEVGTGVTQFWASGSAKWVPFPDYEKQPAIGGRASFTLMRENDKSFYNTQLSPIFSKKYNTKYGTVIPYAGVPFTFIYESSTNNFMISKLCFGSEWEVKKDFQTGAELAIDLYNGTTSYTFTATTLSVFFNFQFDENIGFKK